MILSKCCTQYASKFGKLSSGHGTGKGQDFIPIPKTDNSKEGSNYRTVGLISHASTVMLKILFNTMWIENFRMFKLDSEKVEEPEIKLPTSVGSLKKQERSRKNIYFCFIDYAEGFDYVDHTKMWKILKEMGIPDYITCLLINLYAGQEATFRTRHRTMDWFQIGKGVHQVCIMSPCLFKLYGE